MICIAESLPSIVSSDIPIGPISDEAANAIAAMLLDLVEQQAANNHKEDEN